MSESYSNKEMKYSWHGRINIARLFNRNLQVSPLGTPHSLLVRSSTSVLYLIFIYHEIGHFRISALSGHSERVQGHIASAGVVFGGVSGTEEKQNSSGTLTSRSDALAEAQAEISSGVIAADEIYGVISTLGCDWNTLVVGHVDKVSPFLPVVWL